MENKFWHGKRVFVTGHTGFKGSWLTLWLQKMGASVCGYALEPPTDPNLFAIADAGKGIEHIISDVRDLPALTEALQKFSPDIVFHLAAQPIVRDSYANPVETYAINVMGTVNLLEAVRKTPGVQATVIVTSDKCYENHETARAYIEADPMGGHDPYSNSKGCAELVTSAYSRSFFAPSMQHGAVASGRAGNVIGGGDWANDRLMADLMRGLLAGENIVIRNPRAVRPWQHVLEPLSGYLAVAQHLCAKPQSGEAWNFGPAPGSNQTVEVLARLTCKLWGKPEAMVVKEDKSAPHEAGLLMLDSAKAQATLNWHPRWQFEESVSRTVAWYRAFADKADMRKFTLDQIEAYQA